MWLLQTSEEAANVCIWLSSISGVKSKVVAEAFSKASEQCLSATLLSPETELLRNLHCLHSFPSLD